MRLPTSLASIRPRIRLSRTEVAVAFSVGGVDTSHQFYTVFSPIVSPRGTQMSDTNASETYDVGVGLNRNLGAELKLPPEAGENDAAIVEHTLPPGKLAAPLHRHTNEDEISYILAGRMGVQEGEETFVVEAGETAVKSRGVWHTFWNPGAEPLRFLEIITPGDFAWFFDESDEILPDSGEPSDDTLDELAALHERYEFELRPESVPELIEEHGLNEQ